MNYNSVEEILAAGTTNMTILRNNTKQDDGSDTIAGVNWFIFNETVATNIYASGNSFIGFGSNSEHLKVNQRDGAMYSLYREEGTLQDYYRFLKIRWFGYSRYSSTSSSYKLCYDIILWDTGDISLHMVNIPTSYNTGTYSLVASSTYSYTVSTASPDITFTKTNSGFIVSNNIITLVKPFERRYLIRSGSNYYTVVNNALSEISVPNLTSEVFLIYGIEALPSITLWYNLTNPEVLCWIDNTLGIPQRGLVVTGTPTLPQIVYYQPQDMAAYIAIEKAEVHNAKNVLFTITFDGGQTWKYYSNNAWINATIESEGMVATDIKNITSAQWAEITGYTAFQFRCALLSLESQAGNIYTKLV